MTKKVLTSGADIMEAESDAAFALMEEIGLDAYRGAGSFDLEHNGHTFRVTVEYKRPSEDEE